MKHLDLFSGIGGFALAAERVWDEVEHTFVEIDPFCQEVLKKHWPNSKIYGDIRGVSKEQLAADAGGQEPRRVHEQPRPEGFEVRQFDLLTGGFPCQPFSQAGRRKGTEDDRYLWPEMLRVIREFKPAWIIGENVGGLVTWSDGLVLEQVHLDLEAEGYEVQAFIIPAVSVNAPHRRDRVWIVAHCTSERVGGSAGKERRDDKRELVSEKRQGSEVRSEGQGRVGLASPDRSSERLERRSDQRTRSVGQRSGIRSLERPDWSQNWLEVATRLCRVDDGIPRRLDRTPRLKALGNAIVPQVAEEVMRSIPLLHHGLQDK